MPRMSMSSTERSSQVPPIQLTHISRLSAMATELVAIRQHPTVGDEAREGLDRVVAGLDATITALLHAPPVPAHGLAPDVRCGTDARNARHVRRSGQGDGLDQSALLAWLGDPALPDELAADPQRSAEPVSQLLGRLSSSPRGLTAGEATVVGMPAGTSIGDAAVALLLAVEDPAGPRCRSYRSAAFYLQDHAETVGRRSRSAPAIAGARSGR